MDHPDIEANVARPEGVGYAVLAAVLFGVSTPFAKMLLGGISPVLLAGLLYLGSGLGLTFLYFTPTHEAGVDPAEPHTHAHIHEPLTHAHPHYPDIHHRHGHSAQFHGRY